jgi:two-component system OmpR family sensor kinase
MGLRGRLALYFAAIVAVAFSITFVAVYRGTGSALRTRIDQDLTQQIDGLANHLQPSAARQRALLRSARRYMRTQPFGPAARLLVVTAGGTTITNQPELLRVGERETETPSERRTEAAQARAILTSPAGYSDLEIAEVGDVRVLTASMSSGGKRVATLRAGEPLAPVEHAQDDVARTFLLAGSATLLAAVIAGFLVAARISRPLRRMASTAARVDGGDLSHRIDYRGPHDEIEVLARSFDHMLDRLEGAFARQRAFVSDASHELRTPLTSIRGQLEVLGRQPRIARDDIERVLEITAAELGRMERLVDDLLALAQADERLASRTETIDVPSLLSEAVELEATPGNRRIRIVSAPSGTLRGDRDRLHQVIRNLVRNAVEHTGEGGLIDVIARGRGARLEIEVSDEGSGIPAEERERVFDRFHRGSEARGGGSGLGLAIARGIVEAHGGRIRAEASTRGARIVLELPGFRPSEWSR